MKRFALLSVVLAGTIGVPAQNTFIVHFDSLQNEKPGDGPSVKEVPDGYIVFCEQISHDTTGRTHLFTRKLNQQGQFVSEKEFDYNVDCHRNVGYIDPVTTLDTGGFAVAVLECSNYEAQSWLYKFDQNGDTVSREFIVGFPPQDSVVHYLRQSRQTADGGFAFVGFHDPWGPTKSAAYLVRTDEHGDTLWTSRIGPTSVLYDGYGLAEMPDGGFAVTGAWIPGNLDQSFLARTNSQGDQLWIRHYGERADVGGAVRVAPDSNIVTWSEYKELSWPSYWQQMMLTKWDTAGNVIWQKRSHYNYFTFTWDIEVLDDGSFIGVGAMVGEGVLAKFDSNGDSVWTRIYEVMHSLHYLYDVQPTSDGGFVACGYAQQNNLDPHPGVEVVWVIKTDSFGCVVPGCHTVGVQEYELGLQEHLLIAPNPAHDRVGFSLQLPEGYPIEGPVRAVLLDATGRQVAEQEVERNGNMLSSTLHLPPSTPAGLYYLHVKDRSKWLAGGKVVVE